MSVFWKLLPPRGQDSLPNTSYRFGLSPASSQRRGCLQVTQQVSAAVSSSVKWGGPEDLPLGALTAREAGPRPAQSPCLLRGRSWLWADSTALRPRTDFHSLVHSLFHGHFPEAFTCALSASRQTPRPVVLKRKHPTTSF